MDYKEQIKDGRWQKKRLEILHRDGFKCLSCAETNNLHVHHLHYESGLLIWEYDSESLVTLCERCHTIIHKDLAKISGLIAFKVLVGKKDLNDFAPFENYEHMIEYEIETLMDE
jgi:5-methylcytosine-specific restriction endonuclease McrA